MKVKAETQLQCMTADLHTEEKDRRDSSPAVCAEIEARQ